VVARPRRPLIWRAPDQGLRLGKQASSPVSGGDNPAIASYRFRPLKVPPGAPRNEPDAAALQRANPRLSYEAAYSRMYTHADNAGLRAEINREHLGASMGAVG
jgi:hypothetical protein